MIVDALKAITEGWFKDYTVFPEDSESSKAPTGEFFWVVTSSLEDKPEGGADGRDYATAEAAMSGFKAIIEGLKEDCPASEGYVLYWRYRPELESCIGLPVRWRIYSRLLLSKKRRKGKTKQ